MGKCPECGEWGTLVEEIVATPGAREVRGPASAPVPLTEIEREETDRFPSGIAELDRVLGGGIVLGQTVLIGGEPGVGKSTLLLQASSLIGARGTTVMYVTGEESARQIRLRADRLGATSRHVQVLPETCLEAIAGHVEKACPAVVVVDSVQALFSDGLASAPGSVGQMRAVTAELAAWAKRRDISVLMVGHVTKEGVIAGPKVVEHMVDSVLYLEGERGHSLRVLRSVKNRYGSTNEIGVFEMGRRGLREVSNPSEILLMERPSRVPGTAVVPTVEGTRPVLVEIQALVTPSNLTVPRRTATGVDYNRTVLLIAILEKRLGLKLQGTDVFVNVVGGIKVDEPAVDLGVVTAIASSFREQPVDELTTVMGEVGLTGEVRAVPQIELRLKEAGKLGFARCVIPKGNRREESWAEGIEVVTAGSVKDVIRALF